MTNHIAEQLARRPEPSCGWQAHAQALEKELRWFRDQLRMVERHRREEPDVWYWQGNGEDHLETMVDELPVAIRAGQLRAMFAAYRSAEAPAQAQGEAVAWCQLTPSGQIAYFDGKPMVMPGKVGNECHPHPLYTHAQPAQRVSEWRAPGPVTAGHPLECLIVTVALRQSDGDWWTPGGFLDGDAPLAWIEDTPAARASLGVKDGGGV